MISCSFGAKYFGTCTQLHISTVSVVLLLVLNSFLTSLKVHVLIHKWMTMYLEYLYTSKYIEVLLSTFKYSLHIACYLQQW